MQLDQMRPSTREGVRSCRSLRMAAAFAARFVTRSPVCQLRSTPATALTVSASWAAHSRCRSLSLTRPSTTRGAIRGRSSALPIADVLRPGGSAPNAPRSSAADQSLACHQQLRFAVCGPARWTTPLGCDRRLISGHAARSPGSCCLQMDRGSRHSQRTLWGSCYRSRRRAAAFEPSDAMSRFAELRALRKNPRYGLAQQRAAVRPRWRRRCRVTLGPVL
jgi:hypothetical protein